MYNKNGLLRHLLACMDWSHPLFTSILWDDIYPEVTYTQKCRQGTSRISKAMIAYRKLLVRGSIDQAFPALCLLAKPMSMTIHVLQFSGQFWGIFGQEINSLCYRIGQRCLVPGLVLILWKVSSTSMFPWRFGWVPGALPLYWKWWLSSAYQLSSQWGLQWEEVSIRKDSLTPLHSAPSPVPALFACIHRSG